jgi:hypothetical protein
VWLYGSFLEAAEIGAIISKSGKVSVLDGASADDEMMALNKGRKTRRGTVLAGGRNAVMLHAPDMMGEGLEAADHGFFDAYNSYLETRTDLVSTFDYSTYGDAVQSYVDYISGDVIIVKSTSASINLERTFVMPYNGVLLHTVINSDRMGNFLAEGDNELVEPVSITMADMHTKGDIIHEDYHRNMKVVLKDSTLVGRIVIRSYEEWCTLWEDKGVTEAYWLPDASWEGDNSLSVTLDSGAKWIVTQPSKMTSLTLADNAIIRGKRGKQVIMIVNGEEIDMEPGTYTGEIELIPVWKGHPRGRHSKKHRM